MGRRQRRRRLPRDRRGKGVEATPGRAERAPERRSSRWSSALTDPVDSASLVFFRMCFGAAMLWEGLSLVDLIPALRSDFHFTYYGFGWVEPWPGRGLEVQVYALLVLAVMIAAGLLYRVATGLFFLGFTYLFLLEQAYYMNHFYLICLLSFLLCLMPLNRWLALDARLRPGIRSPWVPGWCLWLLRAQVGIVYLYGGLAKLNADWLRGEPVTSWIAARMIDLPLPSGVSPRLVGLGISYAGLLLDLLIVPALLWRRTRLFALLAALVFHLVNSQLFRIGVFPWLMIAATLLFLEPDWPRRLGIFSRLGRGTASPGRGPEARPASLVATLLGLWLAVQLLVPLRHFLYPRQVAWTEEGHRFSWRMMLREKWAEAHFVLTDSATGQSWQVQPGRLTRRQLRKMATRPDMLQQWAAYAGQRAGREAGGRRFEVRALVLCSLNNREARLLVDPRVDLARVPRSLRPASWILAEDDFRADPAGGLVAELSPSVREALRTSLTHGLELPPDRFEREDRLRDEASGGDPSEISARRAP